MSNSKRISDPAKVITDFRQEPSDLKVSGFVRSTPVCMDEKVVKLDIIAQKTEGPRQDISSAGGTEYPETDTVETPQQQRERYLCRAAEAKTMISRKTRSADKRAWTRLAQAWTDMAEEISPTYH